MIYRRDRGSHGGGVLVAVEDSLSSNLVSSPVPPPSIEVLSVNITSPPITLCIVYIPPNANSNYHLLLTSYLCSLVSVSKFIIILGDFNMIDINWDTLAGFSPTSS